MRVPIVIVTFGAVLLAGCVSVTPPPNRSATDPSDSSAPEASARRFRPNLVATTQVYLDPSVGAGAQKMDHSKMPGMEGMQGMDHSKMPGMDSKQPPAASPSPQSQDMQQMDHSKMPGMEPKESPAAPASKEALETEMKKTSDEMKRLSDEMKAKTDAAARTQDKPTSKTSPPKSSPEAAVYTCPMHPEVKQPAPGNCPKCGMTLVKQKG